MAELNKDDILEAVANMSVMDICDLVTSMEDKFGVSAAAAVAVAAAHSIAVGLAAPAAAGPSQSAAPAADLPPSGAASSSAQFAPRVPPASAVAMAQTQRISGTAGRLPARRAAVLALMDLQVRLMRAGDDTGAAACTSAIFVMQELLARVEQLSHTV